MLNIIDLEKKWLRYKIKSYIPHVTIVISLVIIAILTSIVFKSQNTKEENIATKKITIKKVVLTKEEIAKPTIAIPTIQQPTQQETAVVVESTTKLQPSLSFIEDMKNSSLPYYKPSDYRKSQPKKKREVQKKKRKKKIVTQTTIIEEPISKKQEIIQKKPKVINTERIIIKRKETRDDIKNVIKRFKVNNNPTLSLFVAKKYYEIGNYRESYNYALITNQINSDIELSWIIFSKSLVKLGKKNKAINTLKEYVKASDSNSARLLLEEIQSGNFK